MCIFYWYYKERKKKKIITFIWLFIKIKKKTKKSKIHFLFQEDQSNKIVSFGTSNPLFIHSYTFNNSVEVKEEGQEHAKTILCKEKNVCRCKKKFSFTELILKFPYSFFTSVFTTHYLGMDASSYKNSTEKEKLWFLILQQAYQSFNSLVKGLSRQKNKN